jgi:hypothetical protein
MGGKENQAALLAMLSELDFAQLDAAQQLALVRVYQLSIARHGLPEGDSLTKTLRAYPAKDSSE